MLILPQTRRYGFYHPYAKVSVDWQHPAAAALKAAWIFGASQNMRGTTFCGEISGLVNPDYTVASAGNGAVSDSQTINGDCASVSQSGAYTSNYIRITTNVPLSGDCSFSCLVMRSSDTDSTGNGNVGYVQDVFATEAGGGTGMEFNLGNSYGLLADKNKPRISGTAGIGATAGWLNGVKQSSTNPFDTALTNGVWYGISGTLVSIPAGSGNVTIFGLVGGGTAVYGMSGGLGILTLFNKVLPDQIMADLSLNPYSILNFEREEMPVIYAAVVPTAIFGYTNSPMGSIRRIPNIIGY